MNSSEDKTKFTLDRDSKVPLYKQLYYELKRQIESNEIAMNQPFYSENELIQRYNVSRITVRSTLQLLENEGYLNRSQGNTTTVINRSKFSWNLYELTDDLHRFADELETEVKSVTIVKPTDEILEKLNLSQSTQFVYRIERIRIVNNFKMARSISYLIPSLSIDINHIDFDKGNSITNLLRTLGEDPYYVDETLEAVNGDDKTCDLLELPKNSAVFYRTRITYDKNDKPLEYVESYYNPKHTKYYIKNKLIYSEKE